MHHWCSWACLRVASSHLLVFLAVIELDWLLILRLWVRLEGHRKRVLEGAVRIGLTRWRETRERVTVRLLALLAEVDIGLGRVMSKGHRVLEIGRLHGIEDEFFLLLSHRVTGVLLLLLRVEDTTHLIGLIGGGIIFTCFRRYYLNVSVAGQEFHVRRAVEEDLTRDWR